MTMLSDAEQRVIEKRFHLRNPSEPDLSIHAVFIVDDKRRVYYRKIGRRRPLPPEFIAAIDWHRRPRDTTRNAK